MVRSFFLKAITFKTTLEFSIFGNFLTITFNDDSKLLSLKNAGLDLGSEHA